MAVTDFKVQDRRTFSAPKLLLSDSISCKAGQCGELQLSRALEKARSWCRDPGLAMVVTEISDRE